MPAVWILNEHRIQLQPSSYPPQADTIPLGFLDVGWVAFPPVQCLFLYHDPGLNFASRLVSLQSSLARILPRFYPLAGKLTFSPASDDAIIDCSPEAANDGVLFIEAETDLDFHRVAEDEVHDTMAFHQLVPDIMPAELPAPVFAIQVTAFSDGGLAIGIVMHHAVMDGKGICRFLEEWAAACRVGGAPLEIPLVHDRTLIKYEGGEEVGRTMMRDMLPTLPKLMPAPEVSFKDHLRLARRTFTVDKASIQTLRQIALSQDPTCISAPSTFASLTGHAWACIMRARASISNNAGPVAFLIIFADVRRYLDPPVTDAYSGNCVAPCYVQLPCCDLLGPKGLACACTAIETAIAAIRKDPLLGCEEWHKVFMGLPRAMLGNLASSPRFKAYDIDFGWGRPERVELVSMNGDGDVAMAAGREEGSVQVSVAVTAEHMEAFAEQFMSEF